MLTVLSSIVELKQYCIVVFMNSLLLTNHDQWCLNHSGIDQITIIYLQVNWQQFGDKDRIMDDKEVYEIQIDFISDSFNERVL